MREYFGDGFRWLDLVRTQTWAERAGSYTIGDDYYKADDPATHVRSHTRTIEDYMYLRPIPQNQINGLVMDEADKAAYQNPGYPTK
jgi:hypothetical protein